MPANYRNKNFEHPNVIRYDGTDLEKVRNAMTIAKERKAYEEVKYQ